MTIRQQGGIFGRNPTFNDVDVEGTLTIGGAPVPAPANTLVSSDIGVTVQGYDAATAKTNVSQTFTALQDFNFAGGGNYVATFQTTTLATPYTVNVGEGSGAADGYPLFRVGQSYSPYTDYFRVDSGTTNITVGKSLAMANGKGIDFSATSGTGTSELFSDYEEGDWSPVVRVGSGTGTIVTTGITTAKYTKIGRLVRLEGNITRTDATAHSGTLIMTGMPFTGYAGQAQIGGGAWFDNYPATKIRSFAYTQATLIYFPRVGTTDDSINVQDWDDNRYIYFSINYMT